MIRTGIGYDAHRLVENRRLVLGGVVVPHDRGLLGHSDADVAVHALMDALLGAIAAGDIGQHFPDTDPAWKDADSIKLLEAVAALLRERGWRVVNADMTILCEKPKLAPHIAAMRANIAADLGLPLQSVNIKGKTNEKLGYLGRQEGIEAQAAVLLQAV